MHYVYQFLKCCSYCVWPLRCLIQKQCVLNVSNVVVAKTEWELSVKFAAVEVIVLLLHVYSYSLMLHYCLYMYKLEKYMLI